MVKVTSSDNRDRPNDDELMRKALDSVKLIEDPSEPKWVAEQHFNQEQNKIRDLYKHRAV